MSIPRNSRGHFYSPLRTLTILAVTLIFLPAAWAAESSQYFYRKDGNTIGPVTREKLLEAALEGEINGETYVWSKALKTWKRLKNAGILKSSRGLASDGAPPQFIEAGEEGEGSRVSRPRGYLRAFGGYHLASAINTAPNSKSAGYFGFGAEIGYSTPETDIGLYYGRVSHSVSLGSGFTVGVKQQNILASFTGSQPGFYFGGRFGVSIVSVSFSGGGFDDSASSPLIFMSAPVVGVRIPLGSRQVSLDLEVSAPGTLYEEVFDMAVVSVAGIKLSF